MFDVQYQTPVSSLSREEILQRYYDKSAQLDALRKEHASLKLRFKSVKSEDIDRLYKKYNRVERENRSLKRRLAAAGTSVATLINKGDDLEWVSQITGIHKRHIVGSSRRQPILIARIIFCYISRERGMKLTDIGKSIDRHHSSVINAIQNYEVLVPEDIRDTVRQYLYGEAIEGSED